MLSLLAAYMEDPRQARMIARIEPHPLAAFLFSSVLVLGSALAAAIAAREPSLDAALLTVALGLLIFGLSWIPFTLCLHGICRLLGRRGDHRSLQTQVALALWPLMILPPAGLIQFLSGWESQILFSGPVIGTMVLTGLSLRQAVISNYGLTKSHANIALAGSALIVAGFLGFLLAGLTSAVLFVTVASAVL